MAASAYWRYRRGNGIYEVAILTSFYGISLMLAQIQLKSRLLTIDSSFIVGPEPLPKLYRCSMNDRR
jgi:hypothetical protein